MREYGDYIRETRKILRRYPKMKIAVQNLTEEIDAQEMILRDESIASVRYGDDTTVGGRGELTTVEAAAVRRLRIADRMADMRSRRDEIAAVIRTVDYVLASLNDADCEMVRRHYIDGVPWEQVSREMFYSEKWTRARGAKALHDVALMLFGVQERPAQMKLVLR